MPQPSPAELLAALSSLQSRGASMTNPWQLAGEFGRMAGPGADLNSLLQQAQQFMSKGIDAAKPAPPTARPTPPSPEAPTAEDAGGGSGSSLGEATAGAPTVGSAAQAANTNSMVPGFSTLSNANSVGNLGNTALGLMGSSFGFPTLPAPAMALFSAMNNIGGRLSGLNTDPTTGLPVQTAMARASNPDESASMEAQGFNPNLPATSPLVALGNTLNSSIGNAPGTTISPMSGNQAGFGQSPYSTGTPFGSNPSPYSGETTNFGDTASNTTGNTSPTSDVEGTQMGDFAPGGPAGTGGASPGGSSSGGGGAAGAGGAAGGSGAPGMKRGGKVKDTKPGTDNEMRNLAAGEYVINPTAAAAFMPLLEALNRLVPANPQITQAIQSRQVDMTPTPSTPGQEPSKPAPKPKPKASAPSERSA